MIRKPMLPLPPMARIVDDSRWRPINNHQARRDLANRCIRLINEDRRAAKLIAIEFKVRSNL